MFSYCIKSLLTKKKNNIKVFWNDLILTLVKMLKNIIMKMDFFNRNLVFDSARS